jgi:hypothetical protein
MSNIKEIELYNQKQIKEIFGIPVPEKSDGFPLSTIVFNFPVTFTTLSVEELKTLLRKWIIAEELRYPPEDGYKGRWLLFEEIEKVFYENA